jgi:hypothetical protein
MHVMPRISGDLNRDDMMLVRTGDGIEKECSLGGMDQAGLHLNFMSFATFETDHPSIENIAMGNGQWDDRDLVTRILAACGNESRSERELK